MNLLVLSTIGTELMQVEWDGRDENKKFVSSGQYFMKLKIQLTKLSRLVKAISSLSKVANA
ncbi:MAG: hypothetical protein U9N34_11030, partial [Candidatus Cloacimonadota bacterium]|nr:hypothetical protein [Candidatus Cloacimonadota bacterium]